MNEQMIKIFKFISSLMVLAVLLAFGTFSASGNANKISPTPEPIVNPTPSVTGPREYPNAPSNVLSLNGAPGYCSSSGGSTEFESITSVSLTTNPGGTMKLVVQVYIANPTGCTAGTPCPEYDNSPEYVNVWIDWNGDKSWQPSEKVMDEALTGYLAINYHGTMTAISQFSPPSSVTSEPTWLRANLGWEHDPNDPCEQSWTWGNVMDQQVILQPPKIKNITVQGIGTTNDQPETGSRVRLEADIEVPAGYEITKCSWTGDLTPGEGDRTNKCRYEYTPATGSGPATNTYGEKRVTLTVSYRHMASGATGQISKDHTYKVFFRKDGDDDGDCAWWTFWDACEPNWFEYWGDDGAVPRLNDADVLYDSSLGANSYGYWSSSDDNIHLGGAAAATHYPNGINVPAGTNCPGGTFGGARGIDSATEVVEHEGRHKWIHHNWDAGGLWNGWIDSDQSGQYDDDLPDAYEISTTHTATDTVDSCDLQHHKAPDYRYYGDNEFAVMVHSNGQTGNSVNDWANPGKQTNPPFAIVAQGQLAEPSVKSGFTTSHVSYRAYAISLTSMAKFTGSYADTGMDTDTDGLHNTLKLSVGVMVTETAMYNIVAWLRDSTETDFAWASTQTTLNAGTHVVDLFFDGLLIRNANSDGPYQVARVELRTGDEELLVDSANNVHSTNAYHRTDFDPMDVALTGSYSDIGIDTNADGMYNSLQVNVGVAVQKAGTYTIIGQLEHSGSIAVARTITSLSMGGQTIGLDFDGQAIFSYRQNGPYQLRALRVEDASGNRIDFKYEAYTTNAYSYNQFQHSGTTIDAGSYSDQGLDVDSDGDYDYLRVAFQVSVDQEGAYRLLATLSDSAGEMIANVVQEFDLSTGTNTINLDFPGGNIREHGVNGPYKVVSLSLLRANGTIADYQQLAYTTQAYNYTSFSPLLVSSTGNFRDRAQDGDGDGLYGYLKIDIGVIPGDSGVIVAQGRLVDSTGYEIEWAESSTEMVAGIVQTITLSFAGQSILASFCLESPCLGRMCR